ncbi:MAG TPA: hypothetical protein VF252_06360 [Gemmatimonadales bacterium]
MMARRRRAMVAATIQLLTATPLAAFQAQLNPGARIRVTSDSGSPRARIGTLVSMDSNALHFRSAKDSSLISVPTGSLVRLEQSMGRKSNAGRGAFIGALVGAGTGLLLGLLASAAEDDRDSFYDVGPEDVFAATAVLGAAGAGVGALIGAMSHRDRWEPVPLPGGTGRARRMSGRVGLAIAF